MQIYIFFQVEDDASSTNRERDEMVPVRVGPKKYSQRRGESDNNSLNKCLDSTSGKQCSSNSYGYSVIGSHLQCNTCRAGQVPLQKERVPSSSFQGKKGTCSKFQVPAFKKELGTNIVPSSFFLEICYMYIIYIMASSASNNR